jgi:hypothetical protein
VTFTTAAAAVAAWEAIRGSDDTTNPNASSPSSTLTRTAMFPPVIVLPVAADLRHATCQTPA